jgi:hypothetical protein
LAVQNWLYSAGRNQSDGLLNLTVALKRGMAGRGTAISRACGGPNGGLEKCKQEGAYGGYFYTFTEILSTLVGMRATGIIFCGGLGSKKYFLHSR